MTEPHKVSCYEPNTLKLVKTYDSVSQAAKAENISRANIIKCCQQKTQTCHGYVWRYEGEAPHVRVLANNRLSPVVSYDPRTGQPIIRYDSVAQAAERTGLSPQTIIGACRGRFKTVREKVWRYASDPAPLPAPPYTPATFVDCYRRPVLQLRMDNHDIIKVWDNINTAASATKGTTNLSIYNVCRGVKRSAGGFVWKYIYD